MCSDLKENYELIKCGFLPCMNEMKHVRIV